MPGGGLPGRAVRDMAFFVLFYVFLWRMVEPHLIFHGAGLITNFPSFYTTWGFFTEHLSAPGGPVEYLSALLSQGFYYSWLGALIVTIQAWLLGLCTGYLLKACRLHIWPTRPLRPSPVTDSSLRPVHVLRSHYYGIAGGLVVCVRLYGGRKAKGPNRQPDHLPLSSRRRAIMPPGAPFCSSL